jgi:2-polyprenyl-3-methyl-5-hydroxy-6-metoxy-1,4-benzoquinol methylase
LNMKKTIVKDHFEEHAEDWIASSYRGKDDLYPTADHRARIVTRIVRDMRTSQSDNLTIADLGCGGGNLSIRLAGVGFQIDGIDQAENMIEIANSAKALLPEKEQGNVTFIQGELEANNLPRGDYDVVIAMGVIGYLESDDTLFQVAKALLKPGGAFILSCRNRLFNMNSLSFRTLEDIRIGEAEGLVAEIFDYYQPVPSTDCAVLTERLQTVSERVTNLPIGRKRDPVDDAVTRPNLTKIPEIEARQHTPSGINSIAQKHDMTCTATYGVHPHLIDPNVAKLLPPGLFNELSSCLEAFEHLPVSLVWSSVFLSVFENNASS